MQTSSPVRSSRSLNIVDADIKTKPKRSKKRMADTAPAPKKILKRKLKTKAQAKKKAPVKKQKLAKKSTKAKVTSKKLKVVSKSKKTKPKLIKSPITQEELLVCFKREPLGHLLVEQILREAGFRGGISTDKKILDRYSTDESIFSIRPQIVIQPRNQKDVEIATGILSHETKRFPSLSLTPRAAGTGLSGGSLTDSIVMDVSAHMTNIGEISKKNDVITITCEPGAMLRDVQTNLDKFNAYIPPAPASKDICTVGGCVANNAAGPDSLRYGHFSDWINSLDVTLYDGKTYKISPLTYREFRILIKKDNAHSRIASQIFKLIDSNETEIQKSKPKSQKNTAGYALWDVIDGTVSDFKKGKALFDLTQLIAGSQGTIGIITNISLRAQERQKNTSLIFVPICDLTKASKAITKALTYDPINIEIFDALTYDLALKNPNYFKHCMTGIEYYQTMFAMYTTYHVKYRRMIPEFTLLITIDEDSLEDGVSSRKIARELRDEVGSRVRFITNPLEAKMFWQIRHASYTLSKYQNPQKRPAAFLEDMTVPPENISKFFIDIKKLLKKYNVQATIHGHGGDGHLHFYPLLDFTNKATPDLIEKMSEEFFKTALKYGGGICGEHNDGIIRTQHVSKMFGRKMSKLFKQVESIFDPDDIFNPGKKVNPRFDIKKTMRKVN